ncbi:MAG: hypothetical protein AAF984_09400 [Verrucomicrobiota bacterium]
MKSIAIVLFALMVIGGAESVNAFHQPRYLRTISKNKNKPNVHSVQERLKLGSIHYDSRLVKAVSIAQQRAKSHSIRRCWRYVKVALMKADVIQSYPTSVYAKQAANELTDYYGFKRTTITDPYQAPVGAVLVYGGKGAGHVELKAKDGFVSDFVSATPSPRPLIGVYIKPI